MDGHDVSSLVREELDRLLPEMKREIIDKQIEMQKFLKEYVDSKVNHSCLQLQVSQEREERLDLRCDLLDKRVSQLTEALNRAAEILSHHQ